MQYKRSFTMKSFALLLIAIGVIAGAFGAHALKDSIAPERLEVFKTAVFYQITMATVLLILSNNPGTINRYHKVILRTLTAGIIIFSGSLYLLVLLDIPYFGAITPLGGSFIIVSLLGGAYCISKE
jgi:uncharacterized membrane protein YgdD (TMEM256/DUF423 family)